MSSPSKGGAYLWVYVSKSTYVLCPQFNVPRIRRLRIEPMDGDGVSVGVSVGVGFVIVRIELLEADVWVRWWGSPGVYRRAEEEIRHL